MTPAEGRRRVDRPLVCVLVKRGRFMTATPLFQRGNRMTIPAKETGGARPGSMVLVGGGKRGPRVIRPLGDPETARDVMEAIMVDRGLRRSFPKAVEEDARKRPVDASRIDLTALPTFTIDPVTARDYDDAISARREDGRVRLWVHIADVTAYMRPGTALEAEAYRRGTSVYVPGGGRADAARGAFERGLQPRAAPGPQRGDGRAGDAGGASRERGVPPQRHPQRRAARLPAGRPHLRGRGARARSRGRTRWPPRARWRLRCGRGARGAARWRWNPTKRSSSSTTAATSWRSTASNRPSPTR